MTLAPEQIAWADKHVGEETVLAGAVESWTENDDGTVTFHVSFTATPPPSEAQQAGAEKRRKQEEAEADKARKQLEADAVQHAAEMQQAEEARIREIVKEELAADR